MKHLRKCALGGVLLLFFVLVFLGERPLSRQTTQSSQNPDLTASQEQALPAIPRSAIVSRRPGAINSGAQTVSASTIARKHFPQGKLIDSRLEQLSASEFRRVELIETTLKYPFIRLETRFRLEGDQEVLTARHEVAADHVSVELKSGATEAELIAVIEPIGGTIRRKLNLQYAETYLIGLPQPTLDAVPDAIQYLAGFPNVVAEVDGDGVSRKAVVPNDPHFSGMWHMHNTGQGGGVQDADIDAAEAWSILSASPDVLIAVSDTGVNYNHNDLRENMWSNSRERNNVYDDDRNGYTNDFRGWNFYNGNNYVMDTDGHGTFVSGIIGAKGNNGIGVAGMSWNCKIMVLRVLDTDGGYSSDIAEGFDYARRNGVKLINASHGGSGSSVMKRAVDNLEAAGVLLVASAGNYGENSDSIPLYPASYPNENIISVAATGRDDELLWFSNYGASNVDLAAPGDDILSTTLGNSYRTEVGTSFSAPLVTGVAALLQAQFPNSDCFKIRTRILNNVDKVPSLNGKCVTGGRLNAYKTLLPKVSLAAALDGSGLIWSSSGHVPWIGGTIYTRDKVDAAESGKVWDSQESRLQTTVTGPGKVTFTWKVSSELNYDFLIFYINGSERARISGQTAWSQRIFDLNAGNHTLTWRYLKDASRSGGMDKGFLDQVRFLGVPPDIITQPESHSLFAGGNVTFSVSANGNAPLRYQWKKNGQDIPGASKASLTLQNVQQDDVGKYKVLVSNSAGSMMSAVASLTLCNIALTSSSILTFDSSGGDGAVSFTSTGGCSWEVGKTNSWIGFDSPSTGYGDSSVRFSVAPNDSSYARAAFLTIGNRRFLVRQSGIPTPATIFGKSFSMTVTNASGTLPSSGSFLVEISIGGNESAFRMVGLAESISSDQGTFAYNRNHLDSATLILTGAITTYTGTLTFTSATGGMFTLQHGSGDVQYGVFNTRNARPDFNGDSRNDILLQNSDRVLAAWCMQGTQLVEAVHLRNKIPSAIGWKAVAATDLLGRSELDIIFQGASGQLAAWSMIDGTNFVESNFLRNGIPLGAPWRVVSSADFNQDGHSDLLLQHQDTRAAVWFMNGTEFLGAQHLRNGVAPGAGWRICGVSDFDGDGENDILWQHQNGQLRVWHFVASDFVAVSNLRAAGSLWRVAGIADFNDDGKNDLLFQHKDRRLAVWFMDGIEFTSAVLLRNGQPLGGTWRVVGPK